MVAKRRTDAVKRGKKVKDLAVKSTSAKQAKGVKGGSWIEIDSFSWGAGNPTSVGTGGGTSAGKVSLTGLNIKKP
jgi:hypothetical protein